MNILRCLLTTWLLISVSALAAPLLKGKLLLEDTFDREESNPSAEDIGNGWGTNSKTRAKGQKQVDLLDGAMHITRADVADHGVSVFHEIAFSDATIQLRFKLGPKDDLGINIADMKEKSVHAGHICVARIRAKKVELTDLKTGRMNQELRQRRLDGKLTPADKALIAKTSRTKDVNLTTDAWHDLIVRIRGDFMSVSIDGMEIQTFQSPGIAHRTKSRLRLSVGKSAWVDDVKIYGE